MIIGGPPCQGFSVAGPSQYGIIDQRNTLIMEFFRFIKILKPDVCVLENVKGILSGKMDDNTKALSKYMSDSGLFPITKTSKVTKQPSNKSFANLKCGHRSESLNKCSCLQFIFHYS